MACKRFCKTHPDVVQVLEVNPEGSTFFGKWLCGECGKFLQHSATPRNQSEMIRRQQVIRNMMYNLELNDEELHNLMMIYGKPSLNLLERNYYNTLYIQMQEDRLSQIEELKP